MMSHNRSKLNFRIEQDVDGYPPVAVESVWVEDLGNGRYKVENVPFFARQVTLGDVVSAELDFEGNRWFSEVSDSGGGSLLRAVLFQDEVLPVVSTRLTSIGCEIEYIAAHKILAIHVGALASLGQVQAYLREQSDLGTLDYEEPLLRHPQS
jgi:hypothetical protein